LDCSWSSSFVDGRRNSRTDASNRVETDEVESVGLAEQLLRCAIRIHPRGNRRSDRPLVPPSRVRSGQQWHCAAAYWLLAASSLSAAIYMQHARWRPNLHSWSLEGNQICGHVGVDSFCCFALALNLISI
jgi:hypothetical protein